MEKAIGIIVGLLLFSSQASAQIEFIWTDYTDSSAETIRVYADTSDNMIGEIAALNSSGIVIENYTMPTKCTRYFARAYSSVYGESMNSEYADWCPPNTPPEDPPPIDQNLPPITVPGFKINISVTPQ